MKGGAGAAVALVLTVLPALAADGTAGDRLAEVRVPAGRYYVGKASGQRDYAALANATTSGFFVFRGEVSQGLFNEVTAWGTLHGYLFEDACTACDRSHDEQPVTAVSWRDAALLANALSERSGLDAVYRDASGQPVRQASGMDHAIAEPTLTGYRLPTIPEWQIALRGADKAVADGSYGNPGRSPNALGLVDGAGPLAEWTGSSLDLGGSKTSYFDCNETADGTVNPSNCALHPSGWSGTAVGFRLVRKLAR